MEVNQQLNDTPVSSSHGRRLEALEHLASLDLIGLYNEAKVELCRGTRDSESCNIRLASVLSSCGHASLCIKCAEHYDFCPICGIEISKNSRKFRHRLYYKCISAGLITMDMTFARSEFGDYELKEDVRRIFSLFDVALENNLVSLICHYVADVYMDESAASSDPVMAFLLDEAVFKNWCKRVFYKLVAELRGLYNLELKDMKSRSSLLVRYSTHLAGLSNVLDVLELSVKGSLSRQFHELHQLHESILKTKQHLDVMTWCIRHEFLMAVRSRYHDYAHWRSLVQERKSSAVKRSWPDAINHSIEAGGVDGSLFIEDAIANLEIAEEGANEMGEEVELFSLPKGGGSSFLKSKLEGLSGCYPFENLRTAVDMLFLYGSSDLVVAKRAILLYYLYDRHWTLPDDQWRDVIDDFAASFCVTKHLLVESLTFCLLDDPTDEALKEACCLLPEVSGSKRRPKIARVLLEREMPDMALMVLRWSGRYGGSYSISLQEAVTAVRARVECGLLAEAFTYQRTICNRVRRKKLKFEAAVDPSNASNDECRTWVEWKEILVTEICRLCIHRKLVDRMIELPWDSDEEKYLCKSLSDYATDGTSTITGNLLIVSYLQSKCTGLLPDVQQLQIKSGKLSDVAVPPEVVVLEKSDPQVEQSSSSLSSSIPIPVESSLILNTEIMMPSQKQYAFETSARATVAQPYVPLELGRGVKHDTSVSGASFVSPSSSLKRFSRSSAKFVHQKKHIQESSLDHGSLTMDQTGLSYQIQSFSNLYSQELGDNHLSSPIKNQDLVKYPSYGYPKTVDGTWVCSDTDNVLRNASPSDVLMDISRCSERAVAGEVEDPIRGLRWRSDESSDEAPPQRSIGIGSCITPRTGLQRRRFARQELISAPLFI